MTNSPNSNEKPIKSRLVPLTIAGVVCFGTALLAGLGSWYLFGTDHRRAPEKGAVAVQMSSQISNQISNQNSTAENLGSASNLRSPNPVSTPEAKEAPAGEISIDGGEVTLGGTAKLPLRRVAVAPFAVGETEVTNAQYAAFVKAAKHQSPVGWNGGKFPNGTASEPVVGVSWADANDYCQWLSEKIGAAVRLPNEAEWELAARGSTGFIYPWGNDWNGDAAESAETKGRVRPVKSFPKGRSASGVYDMVGNVYEWTSDLYADEFGKPVLYEKTNQRIIKSGSVNESRAFLTIKFRYYRPENKPSKLLGFRYVVVRK